MIINTLRNKNLYKLFLAFIKIIPNILALLKIITLILNFLKINTFLFTCIGGTSIIFLILLYLVSYVFNFCGTHRLSLHYVSIITILTIIDYYIGIPLTTLGLYYLYGIITGVFMITWIIVWYINRDNPTIDHAKQFCEKYVICCK